MLLALRVFEVLNDVSNGSELVKVFVVNGNIELFFAKKNKVSKLKRVDAEIFYEISLGCDDVLFNIKLIYEKLFNFFGKK